MAALTSHGIDPLTNCKSTTSTHNFMLKYTFHMSVKHLRRAKPIMPLFKTLINMAHASLNNDTIFDVYYVNTNDLHYLIDAMMGSSLTDTDPEKTSKRI